MSRGPNTTPWEVLRNASVPAATPRNMIRDMFGANARGGPDTKAAAEALGVSQRTVQRWIHDRKIPPSSDAGQQLQGQHQQWAAGPQGRRARLGPRREAKLRQQGAQVSFTGTMTVSSDQRKRYGSSWAVSPFWMNQIVDAGLAGNDREAHRLLEDAFGDEVGGSVSLQIEDLQISGPPRQF